MLARTAESIVRSSKQFLDLTLSDDDDDSNEQMVPLPGAGQQPGYVGELASLLSISTPTMTVSEMNVDTHFTPALFVVGEGNLATLQQSEPIFAQTAAQDSYACDNCGAAGFTTFTALAQHSCSFSNGHPDSSTMSASSDSMTNIITLNNINDQHYISGILDKSRSDISGRLNGQLLATSSTEPCTQVDAYQYKCPECHMCFTRPSEYEAHYIAVHIPKSSAPLDLTITNSSAPNSSVEKPRARRPPAKRRKAPPQVSEAPTTISVTKTSKSHATGTPALVLACPLCPKRFSRQLGLSDHLRIHNGDYRFKCPECFRGFNKGFYFRKHFAKEHLPAGVLIIE